MISGKGGDKLLVANNLSDNAVLLDSSDGHALQQFDFSTHSMIPSSFPYTVVATHDGRRAWCSLWNSSRVAELDLEKGTITRWISLLEPKDPTAPGSHPTDLLLSPDEKLLYVALFQRGCAGRGRYRVRRGDPSFVHESPRSGTCGNLSQCPCPVGRWQARCSWRTLR